MPTGLKILCSDTSSSRVRGICADNSLLNYIQQRDWYRRVEVNEALTANDLKREMALAIEVSLKAFLKRAGDNVIDNLGFTKSLFGNVTLVPSSDVCILT